MEPLITYYFPTKEAGEESLRERAVISPPFFYLHLWWARRPLAASRATIATLAINVDKTPTKEFIEEFKKHIHLVSGKPRPIYNYTPDKHWLAKHSKIPQATLIDPFAGGGSIPFEAIRMGFKKVKAIEYNPVAYIILKATLEYPLKYGEQLVRDVEHWAKWLLQNVREELKEFYPTHPKGRPISYIWIRLYKCPEGTLMPSISNPYLSKNKKLTIQLEGFNPDGTPILKIKPAVSPNEIEKTITIRRKNLKCKSRILTSDEISLQYRREMEKWEKEQKYGYHPALLAAVKLENGEYVQPTLKMLEAYNKAEKLLREKWYDYISEDLIPLEDFPVGDSENILRYGLNKFYKLFNARQLLTHITIVKYIRKAHEEMMHEGYSHEYAKVITTYLALGHGRLLDYNSILTSWDSHGNGSIRDTFSRHAYMFSNDFGEGDIIPGSFSKDLISWVFFGSTGLIRALNRIIELLYEKENTTYVEVRLGDASDPSLYVSTTGLSYVVADPPYYNNVQYAELSDFFYVWFKRSIGSLYPDAFMWELTPKDDEIIVNKKRGKDSNWFSSKLKEVFTILRDIGSDRLALMYAHKSSKGLYAMFSALLEAGWKPVSVWGVAAEQPRSQHIVGKAAARSMMVIGAVPQDSVSSVCIWDARVRSMLVEVVRKAVWDSLELGLGFVDATMVGIGAAFKVAGGCWPRRRPDGSLLSVVDVIELASSVASREVARYIVNAELDAISTMYLLAREVYGEPTYDQIRQLGYAFGYSHEKFIERFTYGKKVKGGEKVYPIRSLLDINVERPSSLVEALVVATRSVLIGSVSSAINLLKEIGYSLDNTVCRYIEVLLQDSDGNERKALRALYSACSSTNDYSRNHNRRKRTLEDFIFD